MDNLEWEIEYKIVRNSAEKILNANSKLRISVSCKPIKLAYGFYRRRYRLFERIADFIDHATETTFFIYYKQCPDHMYSDDDARKFPGHMLYVGCVEFVHGQGGNVIEYCTDSTSNGALGELFEVIEKDAKQIRDEMRNDVSNASKA